MSKEMMKTSFLPVFLLLLGALSAKEVNINGNFQPYGSRNYAPQDWAINTYGKKLQELQFRFEYSEPDAQGMRTMAVTRPSTKGDFAIYGANRLIIPVTDGDNLTFTGEARGPGAIYIGCYGYKTKVNYPVRKLEAGNEFESFSFDFTPGDISGDGSAFIRPAIVFLTPGSTISVRNLKLAIQSTNSQAATRRGSRYYPIYKLSGTPVMNIEQDMALWKDIPEARGFAIHKTDQWQNETRQTSFRMAHDGETLYLLMTCEDPLADQIQFDPTEIHKASASLEFGISSVRGPYGTPHAWRKANTLGQTKTSWTKQTNATFPVVLKKGNAYWQMEIALSLDELLKDKEKVEFTKDYFFNIGRAGTENGQTVLSSFAPSGFGAPDKFAVLSFWDIVPSKADPAQEAVINASYYNYLANVVRQIAGKDKNAWENDYKKFGTTSGENLTRALTLSEKAKQAQKNWQEHREIVTQFQAMEKALRSPITTLTMKIFSPENVKKLFVNGSEIQLSGDGKVGLTINQGANVLSAEVDPGKTVRFEIEGHPETLGMWCGKDALENEDSWRNVDFDDRKWEMVKAEKDGSFQSPTYIRQILFWEQTYYSDYRLTVPLRKWGFSRNGLDQMILFLDSPLSFPLDKFKITWDIPQDLTILNGSNPKLYVAIDQTSSPRSGYQRYIYEYCDKTANVGDKKICKDCLMFQLGKELPVGAEFTITYSRSAKNFVELTQTLPCRVLPPVNGKVAKDILWELGLFRPVPDDLFYDFCVQLRKAGGNLFYSTMVPEKFRQTSKDLTFAIHDLYPIWCTGTSGRGGALFEYVKRTPEAQAHYYDSSIPWGSKAPRDYPRYMDHRETTRFCSSFAVNEGRNDILRCIREDVAEKRQRLCPEATMFWNNWERFVDFKAMDICFCQRCVDDFKKQIGLPADAILSKEDIKNKYAPEWARFQNILDGKMMGLVSEAVQQLGMKFDVYHAYSDHGAWIEMGANKTILFNPGCPGSGQTSSHNQATVDGVAKFFREKCSTTVSRGQMILPNIGWGGSRFQWGGVDPDGFFFVPETLKIAVVRLAASLHGGSRIDANMQGGTLYFIGEGTRLVTNYETLFYRGNREDSLVKSKEIAYPNALVLTRKTDAKGNSERLILLFNEGDEAKTVSIENLNLGKNAVAEIWESGADKISDPAKMTMHIPARDVTAIYIKDIK